MILYEALTGRVPFEGDSAVAVAMKQVSQAPRRPSSINPQVSPALDAVVMRALEKDPEARFQSADAFIAALDAAERAPETPRAQDTAAYAAVSPEGETDIPGEEEEHGEYDEDRRRRRRRWILLAILAAGVAALVAFALTRSSHNPAATCKTADSGGVSVPDAIGKNDDRRDPAPRQQWLRRELPFRSQRGTREPGRRTGPDSDGPRTAERSSKDVWSLST